MGILIAGLIAKLNCKISFVSVFNPINPIADGGEDNEGIVEGMVEGEAEGEARGCGCVCVCGWVADALGVGVLTGKDDEGPEAEESNEGKEEEDNEGIGGSGGAPRSSKIRLC